MIDCNNVNVDKMHQQLSADMLVSDKDITVLIDGSGNCIEIEKGVVAIGSGGLYAQGKFLVVSLIFMFLL